MTTVRPQAVCPQAVCPQVVCSQLLFALNYGSPQLSLRYDYDDDYGYDYGYERAESGAEL